MGAHPRKGLSRSNLYIYHLLHYPTVAYLVTSFDKFGNVISTKLYVDRHTIESKGFGFILYDSLVLAEHAIDQMSGFQIASKRLKVQHKRVHHNHSLAGVVGGASGKGGRGGGGGVQGRITGHTRTPPPHPVENI